MKIHTTCVTLCHLAICATCLHWRHFLYDMDIWLKTGSCRKRKARHSELGWCKVIWLLLCWGHRLRVVCVCVWGEDEFRPSDGNCILTEVYVAQALVSFKKYIPPPLPYFKVNICPLPLRANRKWLYPFQWLKNRKCDFRWIFFSNSSEGGPVFIFKCVSRKEKYLGSVMI
jgi:hypothetical protein